MKKILLLLYFFIFTFSGFTQVKPETHAVENLKSAQEIKKSTELKNDTLVTIVKNHETTLKKAETLFKWWEWIVGIFGFTSIASLATFCWLSFSGIKKQADKLFQAKLEKMFTDRYSDMIEILKSYDAEKSIKEKFSITLITHKDDAGSYPREVLTKNGIKFKEFTKTEDLAKVKIEKDSVVMVNNEANKWTTTEVEAYFSGLDNYTFYFGTGIIKLSPNKQKKFGAANIKTQLVGNLLNLLKYN